MRFNPDVTPHTGSTGFHCKQAFQRLIFKSIIISGYTVQINIYASKSGKTKPTAL